MNAYVVEAGMVCLQCKNCDPYLNASEVGLSQWNTIQVYITVFNSENGEYVGINS